MRAYAHWHVATKSWCLSFRVPEGRLCRTVALVNGEVPDAALPIVLDALAQCANARVLGLASYRDSMALKAKVDAVLAADPTLLGVERLAPLPRAEDLRLTEEDADQVVAAVMMKGEE